MLATTNNHAKWRGIYKLGGVAAIGAVLVGIAESCPGYLSYPSCF